MQGEGQKLYLFSNLPRAGWLSYRPTNSVKSTEE